MSRPAPDLGRRLVFALAALLLLPPLALAIRDIRHPAPSDPESGGTGGARQAETAALKRWDGFWETLDAEGESALRPAIAEASLRAAGDTVFMRHANLWNEIDTPERHAFRMAALSNDPERKRALLQPLTSATEPLTRHRAWLELARVDLRRRLPDSARTAARQALAIPDLPKLLTADAWFVLASADLEQQEYADAERALLAATAADPGFWDARQLHLQVLTHQLGQPGQRLAVCLDRTRHLIETLGALPTLAQDRAQFRDIADRLAAAGTAANPALALASGLGYLWAGDRERAAAALAAARDLQGPLPASCAERIHVRAKALLPKVGTAESPAARF